MDLIVKVTASRPDSSEPDAELVFQNIREQDSDRIRLKCPSGRLYDFSLHDLQRVVKAFEVYDNQR